MKEMITLFFKNNLAQIFDFLIFSLTHLRNSVKLNLSKARLDYVWTGETRGGGSSRLPPFQKGIDS